MSKDQIKIEFQLMPAEKSNRKVSADYVHNFVTEILNTIKTVKFEPVDDNFYNFMVMYGKKCLHRVESHSRSKGIVLDDARYYVNGGGDEFGGTIKFVAWTPFEIVDTRQSY